MDNAKNQIADIIKNNANILVSVSTNPSVDELSAALGLTILLNNLDKRATAVFSGAVPPAIDFLEPGKTFENTADSLRDFIIALDKEKADHLRYKVEGDVVKIFITPYKSTLSQNDLDFSQGDYNVEVVIGLGVKDQEHLDKALEAHGKILHDANVMTITAGADVSNLGSIDWHDGAASSLSEMIVGLADSLKADKPVLDEQISTALLTGIVSATDRFSNDKTSSRAMTIAAQLMAAGANQQLIAAKLEEAHDIQPSTPSDTKPTAEEPAESSEPTSELSIKRSERAEKPVEEESSEQKTDLVIEPPVAADETLPLAETTDATAAVDIAPEPEEKQQVDLEKELESLNTSPAGTMADIENELKQASEAPAEVAPEVPLPDLSAVVPTPATDEPVLPELPTLPTLEPLGDTGMSVPADASVTQPEPQIINEHGTFTDKPAVESAPINSIQSDPSEGEKTVDPFTTPTATVSIPPLTPLSGEGTAEGAAILSAQPEPAATPAADPVSIPPLPPLPPLPTDGLPPLPPPPPPAFDPASPTPTSGAVSGDIFGDGSTTGASAPQPAPVPSEPGQFKIPGQS